MKKTLFTIFTIIGLSLGSMAQDIYGEGLVIGLDGPVGSTEVYVFSSPNGASLGDTILTTTTDEIGFFNFIINAADLNESTGFGTAGCPESASYLLNQFNDSLLVVITCGFEFEPYEDLFIAATPVGPSSNDWFFTASVFGEVESYNWLIEGQTYTTAEVSHSFENDGPQEVTLTTQMASGNELFASTIVYPFDNEACQAFFIPFQDSSATSGVVFLNASTGADLDYLWDFGDGTTSTELYPVYELDFENQEEYEICLTVSSESCEDTFCLVVSEASVADWTNAIGDIFSGRPESPEINENVGARSSNFEFRVVPMESVPLSTQNSALDIELGLFPNPTEGNLSLRMETDRSETGLISVFDLSGKAVYQELAQLSQGSNVFNLSLNELPQGVYVISFRGALNLGTRKLVIQR